MSETETAGRAVAMGFVTAVVAEECLALQKDFSSRGVPLSFVEICLKRGLLTREQALVLSAPANTTDRTFKISAPPISGTPAAGGPATRIGRYEIKDELGRGGMGVVYRAVHPDLKHTVAVKVLSLDNAAPDDIARFRREAQMAAKLVHPNIVSTHDFGEADGKHYLAMSYIDGMPFSKIVGSELHTLYDKIKMLAQVCDAVAFAHAQGVIHRDLKPGNILISRNGTAYVTDFGLARQVDSSSHLTLTGMVMGTPAYMSPEQARGGDVGSETDIYSLGAILYETLTGRPPFYGASAANVLMAVLQSEITLPRFLRKGLPRDLETICLKALEKDPRRRYHTAADLAADLRRFLAGDPIEAKPPSLVYRVRKRMMKQKAAWIVAGVALLLTGGIVQVIRTTSRRAEAGRDSARREQERQDALAKRAATEKEAADKLAIARTLFNEGRGQAVLEDLKAIVTKYGETQATPEAQYLIAEIHRAARREREMMDALAKTYRLGFDSEWGRKALFRLAEHLLENGEEALAQRQFEKILARAPQSEEAQRSLIQLGEIAERFNDIPRARAYYRSLLAGGRLRPEEADRLRRREAWLPCVGRSVILPVAANAVAVGDIDGDRRPALVVGSLRTLTVYRLNREGRVTQGPSFVLPDAELSVTAVAIADIDQDGRNEILAASVEYGNRTGWLRVLRVEGEQLREIAKDEIGSTVGHGAIAVADVDGQGPPAIFVGAQYAQYRSYVYHWKQDRLERRPLCPELALTDSSTEALAGWNESEVNAIRVTAPVGKTPAQIVMATGAWAAYDVRILDYAESVPRLRARKLLGSMTGLDLFDWEGSGTSQIYAAKSNFYGFRPKVFGPKNSSGVAEGLYVLRLKDDELSAEAMDEYPAAEGWVVWPTRVQGGRLGGRPVLAVPIVHQRGEERRSYAHLYLREQGRKERVTLNVERPRTGTVPDAFYADLTGSGQDALILVGQELKVYLPNDQVAALPPAPASTPATDLASAAQDLFEMNLFEDAAIAWEKAALETGDPEQRRLAVFRQAECLERLGQIDSAADTYEKMTADVPAQFTQATDLEMTMLGRHLQWPSLVRRAERLGESRLSPSSQSLLARARRQSQTTFTATATNFPFQIDDPFLVSRDADRIRIAIPASAQKILSHPFTFDGTSFSIRMQLTVDRLEWSSYFQLLLLEEAGSETAATRFHYSLAVLADVDGQPFVTVMGLAHLRGSLSDVFNQRLARCDGRTLDILFSYDSTPARIRIECLDAATGEVLWRDLRELSAPAHPGRYELLVRGSTAESEALALVHLHRMTVEGEGLKPAACSPSPLQKCHSQTLSGVTDETAREYERLGAQGPAMVVRARLGKEGLLEEIKNWPEENRRSLERLISVIVRAVPDGPDLARRLLPAPQVQALLLIDGRQLLKHRLFTEADRVLSELAPDAEAEYLLAESSYARGLFDEANGHLDRTTGLKRDPWRPLILRARIASQRGLSSSAVDCLIQAVKLGVRNYDILEHDEALSRISADPGFRALLESMRRSERNR